MLDNFLQSIPRPSYRLWCNQTIPLLILISPNKFLHFYYLIRLHAELGKKFQGKLPNPLQKKLSGTTKYILFVSGEAYADVNAETNHKAKYQKSGPTEQTERYIPFT